ncbi:hypothetical protein OAE97_03145 [Verrucomicrobia bacterium]|jgi:hypothetical protein|nr:hypothetical protein [Verrucomicrobiota bacterium]
MTSNQKLWSICHPMHIDGSAGQLRFLCEVDSLTGIYFYRDALGHQVLIIASYTSELTASSHLHEVDRTSLMQEYSDLISDVHPCSMHLDLNMRLNAQT